VSVQTQREVPQPVHLSSSIVGIDMGIKQFATLSDGTVLELSDPMTKKREIAGLVEAMEKFSLTTGLIITEYEEGEETIDHQGKSYSILIKPIWKWLRILS
jgi:transposase